MRSRWAAALAASAVLAVAGLFLTMATDDRGLAFTLGVRPTHVTAVLKPGDEACQRPIDVPVDAAFVEVQVGTFHRPGPGLEMAVRSDGALLGTGRLPGGYPDNSHQRVNVEGIREGGRVALCARNAGSSRLALYGGAAGAARASALFVEGRQRPADLTLIFHRERPRSMLSLLPAVFERAALFHATWVETWLLWMMAAALAIAVPLLLALALSSARD